MILLEEQQDAALQLHARSRGRTLARTQARWDDNNIDAL